MLCETCYIGWQMIAPKASQYPVPLFKHHPKHEQVFRDSMSVPAWCPTVFAM